MMYTDDGRFEVLAAEREKRGLTQKDICDMTRIPLQHLEALERGDFGKVPGGPYIDAYYRDYCRALGLKPVPWPVRDAQAAGQQQSGPMIPLWGVRFVALALVGLMLGWFGFQTFGPSAGPVRPIELSVPEATPAMGDQILKVHVRKTGRFLVSVDGKVVLDDALEEGVRMTFVGQRSIEVLLPGVGYVNLDYNGRTIVPQGLQNQPRKLVFLDDTEGGNNE